MIKNILKALSIIFLSSILIVLLYSGLMVLSTVRVKEQSVLPIKYYKVRVNVDGVKNDYYYRATDYHQARDKYFLQLGDSLNSIDTIGVSYKITEIEIR